MSRSLAAVLVRVGMLNDRQMEALLARAEQNRQSVLGELLASGVITEQELARCLSLALKIPLAHPLPARLPREVLNRLPASIASDRRVLPLEVNEREGVLTAAFADPADEELQDEICFRTGLQVRVCVAACHELEAAIRRLYLNERPERAVERSHPGLADLAERVPSPLPVRSSTSAGRNIDVGDLFRPQARANPAAEAPEPAGAPTPPLAPPAPAAAHPASAIPSPTALVSPTRGDGSGPLSRPRRPSSPDLRAPGRVEEPRSITGGERRSVTDAGELRPAAPPPLSVSEVAGMQTLTDIGQASIPPARPASGTPSAVTAGSPLPPGPLTPPPGGSPPNPLEDSQSRLRTSSPVVVIDLIKQLLARLIELESRVGDISRSQQDLVELLIKDGVLSRKAYLEWLNSRSRT